MKLIIHSETKDIRKVVKNPKFIPRIGEYIAITNSSNVIVTNVVHTYEIEEAVYIQVK